MGCDNCPEGDGTLHTFRDAGKPVAWFTGVLFPWVCSWTDGDTSTIPWTGEEEEVLLRQRAMGWAEWRQQHSQSLPASRLLCEVRQRDRLALRHAHIYLRCRLVLWR